MRRHLLGPIAALALTAAPGTASAQPAPSGEIEVWAWDIAAAALKTLVPGFNQRYPDVRVNVVDLGNQQAFDRGLAGCAAGGSDLPDVYQIENAEAEVFWNRFPDCFADLAENGAAELRPAFPAFKWTELVVGDAIYALPWDSGPVAVFYRRDLYQKAGVDPASIGTWDDFIAAGTTIKRATGAALATVSNGTDDEWFRMLANQRDCAYFDAAGEAVTVNRPGCVAALDAIKKMADAGVLVFGAWNEQIQNIKSGSVASSLYGAWYEGTIRGNAPEQAGKWGVYRMPAFEQGGKRAANLGGSALALPAAGENQEAAYAFVLYALTTAEGQIAMLRDQGLVPSLLASLRDPYVAQPRPYWGGQPIWQDVLPLLDAIAPSRGTQFFQDARQIVTTIQADYLNGSYETAKEALDAAAEQISGATGLPVAE